MNEQELAKKVVQHLDLGLGQIKEGTQYQLQKARLAALGRFSDAPATRFSHAWIPQLALSAGNSRLANPRNLTLVVFLLLALVFAGYLQFSSQGTDFVDIDAGLLTSDLPIDAYLDSGFEAWLKRSSQ